MIQETPRQPITFEVSIETHQILCAWAAKSQVTVAEVVERLVEWVLDCPRP